MKKLIAGLLGLALSVFVVSGVAAQNRVNRYDSYAVGAPNFTLNSGGSVYGQFGSDGAASKFYLGAGSSQSTTGTAVLTYDSSSRVSVGTYVPQTSSQFEVGSISAVRVKYNGWVEYHQEQKPLATNGTPTVIGTDMAGDVSLAAAATSVVITFAEAPTNIPHCFCSNRISKIPCIAQASATTVTFVGTGANSNAAGDTIDWVCLGHDIR